MRTRDKPRTSKYIDLRFLLATSNVCERLFSKAGYSLTDRRRAISPVNFEYQLYLHCNSDYWGISDVNALLE